MGSTGAAARVVDRRCGHVRLLRAQIQGEAGRCDRTCHRGARRAVFQWAVGDAVRGTGRLGGKIRSGCACCFLYKVLVPNENQDF